MLKPESNTGVNLIIIAGHEPLLCVKQKEVEEEVVDVNGNKMKKKKTKEKLSHQLFLNDQNSKYQHLPSHLMACRCNYHQSTALHHLSNRHYIFYINLLSSA